MQTFRGPKHYEPARPPCPQSSGTCRPGLAGSRGPRARREQPVGSLARSGAEAQTGQRDMIPQEWLNLALSDATAAAGLEDLAMQSWPGKMRGLEYQLAILTDVVETPSDASDHGSFPVASAWPKLPPLAPEKRGSPLRPTSGSRRAVPMYPRARVLLPGLRSPINRVSEASASILIGRAHIKLVVSHTRQRYPP